MQQAAKKYTREEYLDVAETSKEKCEFYCGEVFAMSGGTFNHADISANIVSAFRVRLRSKSCRAMNSDMRIHTPGGLDTYPDVSVFCGKPNLTDKNSTLLNPAIIAEVLSPSTRDYEKGGKFTLYRAIPSLRDYLLVEPEKFFVEHFRKTDNGEWLLHEYQDVSDGIPLLSIEEVLPLEEIYDGVTFDTDEG